MNYQNYILKKNKKGKLKLIRNFEGMYKNCTNPFDQSDTDTIEIDIIESLINNFLKKNKTNEIIDIGSGLGHLTNKIQKKFTKVKTIGSDISLEAVKRANKKYSKIKFYKFDLKMPIKYQKIFKIFKHKKNRLVLAINVLYYLKNHELILAFKNIKTLLGRYGGIISAIYLPPKQNFGKFISNQKDAVKIFKKNGLEIKFMAEVKNNYLDNNSIINSRKHLIFLATKTCNQKHFKTK